MRMDLILVTLPASKTTGKGNHDVLLCSPQKVKKQTFENSVFDPGTTTTYAPAPSRLTGEVLYLRVTFLNRRSRMRHFRPCQPFTADNMRQRRSLSLVLLSQVSRNYKRLPDILDTKLIIFASSPKKVKRTYNLNIRTPSTVSPDSWVSICYPLGFFLGPLNSSKSFGFV